MSRQCILCHSYSEFSKENSNLIIHESEVMFSVIIKGFHERFHGSDISEKINISLSNTRFLLEVRNYDMMPIRNFAFLFLVTRC